MPSYNKKTNYFDAEAEVEVESALKLLVADSLYNTAPSYSTNTEAYPDHLIPFVEKHMNYLRSHPAMDPKHYLANLRLMTRVRK